MESLAPAPLKFAQPAQSRSGSRAPLVLRCEVRQGTRPWQPVLLEDLSATGFRISGLAHSDLAKALSIKIPGMQLLTARLCWTVGPMVGCEFTNPLHVAVFEHLIKSTR
jgi:PilZ domain